MAAYAFDLREAQLQIRRGNLPLAQRILVEAPLGARGWEWRLLAKWSQLESAVRREKGELVSDLGSRADRPQKLPGHSGRAYSVAFSPDSRMLASAGEDDLIRLWDIADEQSRGVLAGHDADVRAIAFTASGQLVSAGFDRRLKLWDIDSRREIKTIRSDTVQFLCVAVSSDGKRVFAGGGFPPNNSALADIDRWQGGAVCWDLVSNSIQFDLGERPGVIRAIAAGRNGHVITGSYDGRLSAWNADDGALLRQFSGHRNRIFGVTIDPAEKIVCSCSGPTRPIAGLADISSRFVGGFRWWNLEDGEQKSVVKAGESTIYSAVFTPDGTRLLTGGADNTLRVWDVETELHLITFSILNSPVESIAIDGDMVATASKDGSVHLWNAGISDEIANFQRQSAAPAEVSNTKSKQKTQSEAAEP